MTNVNTDESNLDRLYTKAGQRRMVTLEGAMSRKKAKDRQRKCERSRHKMKRQGKGGKSKGKAEGQNGR